jgi:ABC-type nitrate/sulfonate/bicarbonate transport system substrate-binding protein
VEGLQDFIDFLHRWEFIPNHFKAEDWIDARPLDEVLGKRAIAA